MVKISFSNMFVETTTEFLENIHEFANILKHFKNIFISAMLSSSPLQFLADRVILIYS